MIKKTLFIFITTSLLGLSTKAQDLHNPLSLYGIGEFVNNDQTAVVSNGWANQTFYDRFHVNINNPASYSYLLSSTFETGINASYSTFQNNTSDYSFWSGQLAHMSLAFPIFSPYNELLEKKNRKFHWGMGIAIKPYTRVAYNYDFITDDPQVGPVQNKHFGKGGTYKLHYNNGLSYKNFSAGIGLQYIFGKILRTDEVSFNDNSGAFGYVTSLEKEVYVKGLQYHFSAMYNYVLNPMTNGKKTDFDKEKRITIGASFQPTSRLKTNVEGVNSVYSYQLGTSLSDTLSSSFDNHYDKNTFNSSYGIGLSYQHGANWQININYDNEIFDKYALKGLEANYSNSGMFKIGGEWCPEPNSFNSFLKRSKYRLGFRTGKLPLTLDSYQTTIKSAVLGYGFPIYVNRQISYVNFAIEGGLKTYNANLSEKYIKLQIGFNLNDDYWFLKRKFD